MTAVNEVTARAIARGQHREAADRAFDETNRQLEKWGVQNHPAGHGPDTLPLAEFILDHIEERTALELEHIFRERCELRHKAGRGTYMDILLEEVFEAAAAGTPEEYEIEMEQVAAVALSASAASRRARGA